jgi:hypothetical protein
MPRFTDVCLFAVLAAGPAFAHHEAIFGPQSSLVLSSPAFVSLQTFSRTTLYGTETTGLVSAGVTPFNFPLSFTAIVPAPTPRRPASSPARTSSLAPATATSWAAKTATS